MPIGSLFLETRLLLIICVFAIVFWTLEPAPTAYTALVILSLVVLTNLLTFEEAWQAAGEESIWLIFAGMAISQAVNETKLPSQFTLLVSWLTRSSKGVGILECFVPDLILTRILLIS